MEAPERILRSGARDKGRHRSSCPRGRSDNTERVLSMSTRRLLNTAVGLVLAAGLVLTPAQATGHHSNGVPAKGRLTNEVLRWEPLVASVFPPDKVRDVLSVMACESRGDPSVKAGTLGSFADEFSVGLMQINTEDGWHGWLNGWGNPHLALKREFKGIGAWQDLLDPLANLRAAAFISRGGSDWSHWTCQP